MKTSGDQNSPSAWPTTPWPLVRLAARSDVAPARSRTASGELFRLYAAPVLREIAKRASTAQAEDLKQEFFTRLIARNSLRHADPNKGRFRSWMRVAIRNLLHNEHAHETAVKRGGERTQVEARDAVFRTPLTPESLVLQRERSVLAEAAKQTLRQRYHAAGKGNTFDALQAFLPGLREVRDPDYAAIAQRLGCTANHIKVRVHQLRVEQAALVRCQLRGTLR